MAFRAPSWHLERQSDIRCGYTRFHSHCVRVHILRGDGSPVDGNVEPRVGTDALALADSGADSAKGPRGVPHMVGTRYIAVIGWRESLGAHTLSC